MIWLRLFRSGKPVELANRFLSAPPGSLVGKNGIFRRLKTVAAAKASIFLQMEANLMKPFITPRKSHSGKTVFEYQLEGGMLMDLEKLKQRRLLAYELPGEQNFQQSWEFKLHFDNNISLEFSSACTQFQG